MKNLFEYDIYNVIQFCTDLKEQRGIEGALVPLSLEIVLKYQRILSKICFLEPLVLDTEALRVLLKRIKRTYIAA